MLHLLLVGDGMSRAALEAKVKELHAEDAVTFYGSVLATDIPKFTALADALIVCLSDSPDLGLTVRPRLPVIWPPASRSWPVWTVPAMRRLPRQAG